MGGWSERVMGQKGFFDVERRLEAISAKGDPLETIKKMVQWDDFRADIEAVTETKPEERQSNAGRKPYDTILKFKIVVLQSLHNLSDEQTEYLIRDRLSFMRFLDLELEDPVLDATTIWLFREALAEAGLIDQLFARFGQHLEAEGYIARGGQIIDATIVSVPKQRNTKEENEAIKAGKTPEGWEQQPAKNAQKDKDARWTKKNDESFYGYKNHIGVDKAHKLIRKWEATDAAVHDSQKLDDLVDLGNPGKEVWADSPYRWMQIEARLQEKGLQSRIHRRGARNRPLSEREKSANTTRSKVRARVEHVFGHQQSSMGGKIVRTIGIVRAKFKIGMMNLGYNIRRWPSSSGWRLRPLECAHGWSPCGVVQKDRAVRLPGVKTVPDRGPTLARALQPLAQLSRNRRKRVLFEVPNSLCLGFVLICHVLILLEH